MEIKEDFNYNTSIAKKIVLACSGGSDLGDLSDKVARKLRNDGIYNMKCLAMVAANNKEMIVTLKSSEILVIDGCPIDCGKKIMEKASLTRYEYVRLTDLGFVKGQTSVNDETIKSVLTRIVDETTLK